METKQKELKNLLNLQKRNNTIFIISIIMFALVLLGLLFIFLFNPITLIIGIIIILAGSVLSIVQLVKIIILLVQWLQEENPSKANEMFTKYTALIILTLFFGWIPSLIIKILVNKDVESDYFINVDNEEITENKSANKNSMEIMLKIEKSKELLDKNAITEEEYNEMKKNLLEEISN